MKLATRNNHTRDGELIIVNQALTRATSAHHIAPTLQYALDNWSTIKPKLEALNIQLATNEVESFAFEQSSILAPLPRAYQWLDGSAYLPHVERVRKARGAEVPESFFTDPLMYQGGSDTLLSATSPVQVGNEAWGIDCEAEVAVITSDVPYGISATDAVDYISLIVILNDVSLRNLVPAELAKGFGFMQSKPPTAFSLVAITPDELNEAWKHAKVHLPLITHINNELLGSPNAGVDMQFNFAELIAHAAKTRPLYAGTIIGSGTVSNQDTSVGCSCLAERRMLEIIEVGEASTPFLHYGDTVTIEMLDANQNTIFGQIKQTIEPIS